MSVILTMNKYNLNIKQILYPFRLNTSRCMCILTEPKLPYASKSEILRCKNSIHLRTKVRYYINC